MFREFAAEPDSYSARAEVHEPPWLDQQYKDLLKSNMVIAVEPKLWKSGNYYFRVEDIVLVGKKKTEFLTKFDRDIFQL